MLITQAQNNYVGTYKDHFGRTLMLNLDSSFRLFERADLSYRYYKGEYRILHDTLYLSYFWNHDTIRIIENIGFFRDKPIEIRYNYQINTWEGYTYEFDSWNEWFSAYISTNRFGYWFSPEYWEEKLLIRKNKIFILKQNGTIDRFKDWNSSYRKRYQRHLIKIE